MSADPDYSRLLLAYIRAPKAEAAEARAALHAAGFPISKTEAPQQQELPMPQDSVAWLEMMGTYGPRDCRETCARIAEELRGLRKLNELLSSLVRAAAADNLPIAAE